MEGRALYRKKKDKKRIPMLTSLQREDYDTLPIMFSTQISKQEA